MKRHLKDISNCDGRGGRKRKSEKSPSPEQKIKRVKMEKRRRDKINHYVDELSDLVPAAAHKKAALKTCDEIRRGGSKLEKAEILELTVEHVRKIAQGKQSVEDLSQYRAACAEVERKRGFQTCLQQLAQFLNKSESLMEQNEKILSGMKNFLNSQIEPNAFRLSEHTKNVYESYISNESEGSYEFLTHQNIFYKICMDFLKNNSTSNVTQDERNEPEAEPFDSYWQENSEVPHMMSLSCENFGAIDDLNPPFGSFSALLASYQ